MRARLEKRLQDELARGRIARPATARAYEAAAGRFLAFAAARGVFDGGGLLALEAEFLRSESAAKSDRAAGKPVFGHLCAVLVTAPGS